MAKPHRLNTDNRRNRTEIGLALKALRTARGVLQKDLASKLGLTPAMLSRTEDGLRDLMFDEAVLICGEFNITLTALHDLIAYCQSEGYAERKEQLDMLQRQLTEEVLDVAQRNKYKPSDPVNTLHPRKDA